MREDNCKGNAQQLYRYYYCGNWNRASLLLDEGLGLGVPLDGAATLAGALPVHKQGNLLMTCL